MGPGDHLADVLDRRRHRRQRLERLGRGRGDDAGQSGLTGARRAPQDHRRQPVGLDESPQRRARRQQVVLADDVVEPRRPQPVGQRGVPGQALGGRGGEQIVGHGRADDATRRSRSLSLLTMLSSDEVSAILRRAAELEDERESAAGLAPDRIDLDAVEQAAGEVGISLEAVRQAYAELQVGGLPIESDELGSSRPRLLGPAQVAEQRVIRLPVDRGARPHRAGSAPADLRAPAVRRQRQPVAPARRLRRPSCGGASTSARRSSSPTPGPSASSSPRSSTATAGRPPSSGSRPTSARSEGGTATASVAVPTTVAALAGGIGALAASRRWR